MKLTLRPPGRQRRPDSVAQALEQIFESPFAHLMPEVFYGDLSPAVNIAEDEKSVTVAVELPGLEEKDIQVQVLGNQLIVSAERRFDEEKKGKEFHRVEHQYGSFSRTIVMPSGLQTDKVEAVYKKGILTVSLPKLEPTPATKVKVRSDG
jgi:HSP20 family protein